MIISFRFIIVYAIGVSTFVLILDGIIIIMVIETFNIFYIRYNICYLIIFIHFEQKASLIVKIQFITLSLTVLTEIYIYIYAWPADYMKDMVNYAASFIFINI